MSEYTPHAWVIVRISDGRESVDKVLAGWYGGYLSGDSWRMNSGISEVKDADEYYDIYGHSGSVYHCHKEAERMSGYMGQIYMSMEKQFAEQGGTIEVIPIAGISA